MSILIRGMEMPKDCLKCTFCLFADGYWKCLVNGSHADFGGTCRPQNCPLVSILPHGRLIDADALMEEFRLPKDLLDPAQVLMHITGVRAAIQTAPTIIQAEEAE